MERAIIPGPSSHFDKLKYVIYDEHKNEVLIYLDVREDIQLAEIKNNILTIFDDVNIIVLNKLKLEDEIKLIWPTIVSNFNKHFSYSSNWLNRAQLYLVNNDLNIKMETEIAKKKLSGEKELGYLNSIIKKYISQIDKIFIRNGDFLADIEDDSLLVADKISKKNSRSKQGLAPKKSNNKTTESKSGTVYGRKIRQKPNYQIKELNQDIPSVIIKGEIFALDIRETRSGKFLYILSVTDKTGSITAKFFVDDKKDLKQGIKVGDGALIRGKVQFDPYSKDWNIMIRDLEKTIIPAREDKAVDKRVELHLHTQMSAMDSVVNVDQAVATAARWGHPAIAVTDHGVAQAFPDAYQAGKKHDIKIIYGMEAYLVSDGEPIIINPVDQQLQETEFIVFDLETTGLNPNQNEIIEIGAVKIKSGEIIDKFSTFVKPLANIPAKITEITGIDQGMVADAPELAEVLPKFLKFAGEGVLVAHNADFDYGFIRAAVEKLKLNLKNQTVLDTLSLSRALLKNTKNHKLNTIAVHLGVELKNHHRALDDASATADILLAFLEMMSEKNIFKQTEINKLISQIDWKDLRPYHAIILAKNKIGLKNLYKLISFSHLDNFYRKPRVLKSKLIQNREGLILGSACEAGELYRAILNNKPEREVKKIAKFYDYLEIQPIGNNNFLIPNQIKDENGLKEINKRIFQLGKKLSKPVVGTCDVHFLDEEDKIYREILQTGQKFQDADQQPPIYLRTTEEMLNEFSYLGEEAAQKVVVENSNLIADQIEELKPLPDGLFTPKIEGAETQIRDMSYNRAKEFYGENLPQLVIDRLEQELDSIIKNGFAVIYLISHKLVKKSLEDGYLVGSRGSVGSSLVATMTEITEVNPLPPHYRCPRCQQNEFISDHSIGTGVDLPDKNCPNCGSQYIKDGFDIPFEVFMGFKGDKVPDIDLNFSGEYQNEIHQYTEDIFGRDYVFRAGTISTIAERTAFGFVKNFLDEKGINVNKAEINRLVNGCTGVRRTTGQHPGGLMVVPRTKDIFDFSPIQHPANDQDTNVRTTHFDYHSISGRILKLDLLGHDDPTSLRMLQDLTGIKPAEIPLDDPKTMSIFSSTRSLNVKADHINTIVGTLGIPEFGTSFVRQMLVDTEPTSFAELIRISGLSHGTDVWLNNAQNLIRKGKAKLAEVISVRDDIMNYLIQKGLKPGKAFWIMEHVRKGKGLTDDEEEYMRDCSVPEWYINSCKKIKYMFPKAHAAAYVMMAFRIAYFKVHYPAAFYTTYFSIKAEDFDAQIVGKGHQYIISLMEELEAKGNEMTAKESNTVTVLQIVVEAIERGIEFLNVDLYESDAFLFKKKDKKLLPPLISLQGLGRSAAESVIRERQISRFTSIEELVNRTSLTKTVVEILRDHGSLEGMPERNQISLF